MKLPRHRDVLVEIEQSKPLTTYVRTYGVGECFQVAVGTPSDKAKPSLAFLSFVKQPGHEMHSYMEFEVEEKVNPTYLRGKAVSQHPAPPEDFKAVPSHRSGNGNLLTPLIEYCHRHRHRHRRGKLVVIRNSLNPCPSSGSARIK